MALHNFAVQEREQDAIALARHCQIHQKQHVMFSKFCAISIDGFKRDRYMLKIDDMTAKVQ
jgi:hypothetical protein